MAETWAAGSICKAVRVPFDAGYTKVVHWTVEERDAWFDQCPSIASLEIQQQTYIRPSVPLVVDAPYSAVYGANYLVVYNPAQPVEGAKDEHLFYFITDTQYASPSSTRLVLQLDVWQTRFIAGAELGTGFVERGHYASYQLWRQYSLTGEAGKSANWCEGLRYYANVPEGLDVGSDYDAIAVGQVSLQDDEGYVLILSKVDLESDFGTVQNPNLVTATGGAYDGLMSGSTAYLCAAVEYYPFFNALQDYSWISQNILGCYYIPSAFIDEGSLSQSFEISGITLYKKWASNSPQFAIESLDLGDIVGDSYDYQFEPEDVEQYMKLLAYPYAFLEVSCANSSPVLYKLERFQSPDVDFDAECITLPPFTRMMLYPRYYNSNHQGAYQRKYVRPSLSGTVTRNYYYGDGIDNALTLSNLPQYSGVSDNYITYMASTANRRAASYAGAGWSRTAANASARTAYEQNARSLATNPANMDIQNELLSTQRNVSAIGSGLSALGSLATGNVGGALMGGASAALGYYSSVASQDAANQQFANTQQLGYANADANYQLAAYISAGNYQQQIMNIDATAQDAQLTPPSIVGQEGGDGFNAANGYINPIIKLHRLTWGNFLVVAQYFKRYGYEFHRWIPMPSKLVMNRYFSYWKVLDLTLECATANETESDAIRGIFAQGVSIFPSVEAVQSYNVNDNYHE